MKKNLVNPQASLNQFAHLVLSKDQSLKIKGGDGGGTDPNNPPAPEDIIWDVIINY